MKMSKREGEGKYQDRQKQMEIERENAENAGTERCDRDRKVRVIERGW